MISSLIDRMLGRTLSCKQVSDFLADYLDGDLDPLLLRRFERHIGMCANCAALLDQYRTTVELLRQIGADLPEPPPELAERTLEFLHEHPDLFEDPGPGGMNGDHGPSNGAPAR